MLRTIGPFETQILLIRATPILRLNTAAWRQKLQQYVRCGLTNRLFMYLAFIFEGHRVEGGAARYARSQGRVERKDRSST